MAEIAVVTDSTHYMPRELVAELGLEVVSLYVNWNGRTDREIDLDLDAYYEHLRGAETLPTTSQPPVGDFLAVYEPLLAAGKEIVSIHLSSGISGTYDAALQAKQELEDGGSGRRITVIDSKTTAGGLGIMAYAAASRAKQGGTSDQVVESAEKAREALKLWFCVDTMEFLRRGGRVGAARAWLGSTLRIKPILTIEEEVTPVERVRTAKRAFERMVDYLRDRHEDGADAWVVQHVSAPDSAARLVEEGIKIFGHEPLFVSEIGPVVGTHTGPGLVGVGGVPSNLLR